MSADDYLYVMQRDAKFVVLHKMASSYDDDPDFDPDKEDRKLTPLAESGTVEEAIMAAHRLDILTEHTEYGVHINPTLLGIDTCG